jgi:hypothetical protein
MVGHTADYGTSFRRVIHEQRKFKLRALVYDLTTTPRSRLYSYKYFLDPSYQMRIAYPSHAWGALVRMSEQYSSFRLLRRLTEAVGQEQVTIRDILAASSLT